MQPPHVPRIALHSTAFRRGRAATTPHVQYSEGNYQGYIEDLKRRKGPDADQPHCVQYRKLVRA
jgi:energy-dependent translational throttle protein EttA